MADEEGHGLRAISHRLPVTTTDGVAPKIFTVDLAPNQEGTFLVTCRELPAVVMLAQDEEEGLVRAEQAIKGALEAHRPSLNFPY